VFVACDCQNDVCCLAEMERVVPAAAKQNSGEMVVDSVDDSSAKELILQTNRVTGARCCFVASSWILFRFGERDGKPTGKMCRGPVSVRDADREGEGVQIPTGVSILQKPRKEP